jgi:16S rRNA (guanine527-N7)-methyltransferase
LGLTVRVVCARAEEAAHEPELRERFASATARALGSAAEVLELTVPFLAVGGVAVLQRGAFSDAERRAAIEAAYTLGAELTAELPLGRKEPNDEGRRIVLATKCDRTPAGFPRRGGLPRRRPLGSPSRKVGPAAS